MKATAPKEIEILTVAQDKSAKDEKPVDPAKKAAADMRNRIARRAAKELKDGYYVNLGIGMPMLAPSFLPEGVLVHMQSENGILDMGPYPTEDEVDA